MEREGEVKSGEVPLPCGEATLSQVTCCELRWCDVKRRDERWNVAKRGSVGRSEETCGEVR